jgi:hypothetical protein
MSSSYHRSRARPASDRPRGISQQTIPRCFFYLAQSRLTRKSTVTASLFFFYALLFISGAAKARPCQQDRSPLPGAVALPGYTRFDRTLLPSSAARQATLQRIPGALSAGRKNYTPTVVFPDKWTPAAANSLVPSTMPPNHPMNNPVHNAKGNKPDGTGIRVHVGYRIDRPQAGGGECHCNMKRL